MMHGIHKFHDVWAWFIVVDGRIIDQGHSEDKQEAVRAYNAATAFWSTHDYEVEK